MGSDPSSRERNHAQAAGRRKGWRSTTSTGTRRPRACLAPCCARGGLITVSRTASRCSAGPATGARPVPGACRRDHGAVAALLAVPAGSSCPPGTGRPASEPGKVIVVLPAGLRPLRTSQLDRHLQQAVRDRWGETFGDDVVAAAMIDRLVHHAEVIALKGDSYGLKNRDLGRVPRPEPPTTDHQQQRRGSKFSRRQGVKIRAPLTPRQDGPRR